jgi:hypothetical protein
MVKGKPWHPVTLGDLLVNSPESFIRAGFASNPACPAKYLHAMSHDEHVSVRVGVASNEATPKDTLLRLMYEACAVHHESAIVEAAEIVELWQKSGTPWRALRHGPIVLEWNTSQLASGAWAKIDRRFEVLNALLLNPQMPIDVALLVISKLSTETRMAIAVETTIPVDLMRALAHDDSWQVRKAIAGRFMLPRDILDELAKDPDEGVRRAVAGNYNTSAAALAHLETDDSDFVRYEHARRIVDNMRFTHLISENQSLTQLDSQVSLKFPVGDTRFREWVGSEKYGLPVTTALALAQSQTAPFDCVLGYLEDVESFPKVTEGLFPGLYAAKSPLTPLDQLYLLAASSNSLVRAHAVEQIAPLCQELDRIATYIADDHDVVRAAVARYARTDMPLDMWYQLAGDESVSVVQALIDNDATPTVVRGFLLITH